MSEVRWMERVKSVKKIVSRFHINVMRYFDNNLDRYA